MEVLDVISRIAHVGTAIVVLGGSIFMRFMVMPSAAELPDEEHQKFRDRLIGRWKRVVHLGIAVFILSGFYNYMRAIPTHKGVKLYHPLIGVKILLAFAVFFLASALVGRSAAFEPMRKNARKWLTVIIALAAIIVAISGFAKIALKKPAQPNMTPQEVKYHSPDGTSYDS